MLRSSVDLKYFSFFLLCLSANSCKLLTQLLSSSTPSVKIIYRCWAVPRSPGRYPSRNLEVISSNSPTFPPSQPNWSVVIAPIPPPQARFAIQAAEEAAANGTELGLRVPCSVSCSGRSADSLHPWSLWGLSAPL